MELSNNEYIEIVDITEQKYMFRGINNEVFHIKFDETDKYFKINDYGNYENLYREPDLKKLLVAYKYKNNTDNCFIHHYQQLKIVNINTIFKSYYDIELKETIYLKEPQYYTYLIVYDNYCTILSYNQNKYCTKKILLNSNGDNDYEY